MAGGPSVQNKSVLKSQSYLKSLGAVALPVEIRRRVFTQWFCFVYLFVCLFVLWRPRRNIGFEVWLRHVQDRLKRNVSSIFIIIISFFFFQNLNSIIFNMTRYASWVRKEFWKSRNWTLKLWQFVKVYLKIHRLLSSIKRASRAFYGGFEKREF